MASIYRMIALCTAVFMALQFPAPCDAQVPSESQGCATEALTLENCISLALDNSMDRRNARLDVTAAQEQKKEALWHYFPDVSVFAGAFQALKPMIDINVRDILGDSDAAKDLAFRINTEALSMGINPVFTTMQQGRLATVRLMQPVYAGGRIVNGNRLAAIGVEAAQMKEALSGRETSAEVEKLWYGLESLLGKEETLLQALALVGRIVKDADAAVSAGLASPSDLMLAESRKSSLEVDLLRVRNGILLSRMNLFNLIGLDYCVLKSAATPERPYIGDIELYTNANLALLPPERYWRDEEEICASLSESKLLELSVKAKRLEKKMAVGESLPQLGVGASYGYSLFLKRPAMNGTVFATLSVPITQWGQTSHKIRRMEAQQMKAENEREYLGDQLLLMVRKTWLDAQTAWLQMEAAQSAEEAAAARLERIRNDYEAGMATLTNLLEAQMSLRNASDTLSDLRCEYLQALGKYRRL